MPKVAVLEKDVADKIAAGEVVDRPASVVKELVENCIDAGATRVEVELEDGGKRLICVRDNGCGMVLEDAVLALERHATSKIRAAEDLFSVRTLGFRGEALPSIASVSSMRILTRAADEESGVEIVVERGQVVAADMRGAPQGTQITVTDLFANTPARLKFLKATQTETAHILDLIVRFALSYPHIHFRLLHNNRQLFSAPGAGDPLNTVVAAYGHEVAREMLPVGTPEGAPVEVRGYVSRPSVSRAARAHQSFFVNGRLVRSPILSRALDEAYRGALPAGRFPVACLFVQVDPSEVDVNVHPTKMEVRFSSERQVFEAVSRSVRETLSRTNLAMPAYPPRAERIDQEIRAQSANAAEDPFANDTVQEAAPQTRYQAPPALPPAPPTGAHPPRELRLRPEVSQTPLDFEYAPSQPTGRQSAVPEGAASAPETAAGAPEPTPTPAAAAPQTASTLPELNPVARVLDTYLVCESAEGLYLIDYHAAHERVMYDALLRRDDQSTAPQPLLIPLTLALPHSDALLLEQYRGHLAELGFEIEPFGRDTYVLRSVPMLLVGKNYGAVLQDVIDDLRDRERSGRLSDQRAELCALVACHSVTRSGDALTPEEMKRLVQDLRESPAPYTCAHGRPTMLVLTRAELERKIGR